MNRQEFKKQIFPRITGMVLTLVVLVSSLFLFFNSSLGWFAALKNVDGQQGSVSVEKFDAMAEYFVYIYDAKQSTQSSNVIHYTGEGLQTDPSIDNIDMQFYDTIFKGRNRYTPAIVRIRLYDLQKTSGTVQIKIQRDMSVQGTITQSGNTIPNSILTNAIRFTVAQSKNWYSTDVSSMFSVIDSSLYPFIVDNENYTAGAYQDIQQQQFQKGTSKTFVYDVQTDNGRLISLSKTDYITLSVPFSQSDIVDGDLNIYLYLTYDKQLVDYFGVSGIISNGSTIGQVLDLQNDLSSMIISIVD